MAGRTSHQRGGGGRRFFACDYIILITSRGKFSAIGGFRGVDWILDCVMVLAMRIIRFLRGFDLVPKVLFVICITGNCWYLAQENLFDRFGVDWEKVVLTASVGCLVSYWAFFGFRRRMTDGMAETSLEGVLELSESLKKEESGQRSFWYKNGIRARKCYYQNGKLIEATVWRPNGNKCADSKVEGGRGIVVYYNEDGTELGRAIYENGEQIE